MWKDFFPALDAIVFIVDASDTQRLLESKHELDSLLNDVQLAQCPVSTCRSPGIEWGERYLLTSHLPSDPYGNYHTHIRTQKGNWGVTGLAGRTYRASRGNFKYRYGTHRAVTFLILGDKIDQVGALSKNQLYHYFDLYGKTTGIFNYESNHVTIS